MLNLTQIIVGFINQHSITEWSDRNLVMKEAGLSAGPVWPSGKALGWQAGPRFDSSSALFSLFKSSGLWTVFVTLHFTEIKTLKWLSSLPI